MFLSMKPLQSHDRNSTNKHQWSLLSSFSYVAAACLAVSLTGCSQDPAVKEVASFSESILPRFKAIAPQLAQDIKTSCGRLQAVRLPTNKPLFQGGKFVLDEAIVTNCSSQFQADAISAFIASNTLIYNYLLTIGKLADAKVASIDTEMTALVDAIGKLPVVSQPEINEAVGAAGAISKILVRTLTQGYQKSQLRSVMTSTDLPLREVSKIYTSSLDRYYTQGILSTELIAVNAFYGTPVQVMTQQTTNPFLLTLKPLFTPALTKSLLAEREAVAKRVVAAQTYTALIREISCDHERLVRLLSDTKAATNSPPNTWCDQKPIALIPSASSLLGQPVLARNYARSALAKYDRMLARLESMNTLSNMTN